MQPSSLLLAAALAAALAAVELGHVPLRLPFPPGAEYDYMALTPPPGSLPPRFNASFGAPGDTDDRLARSSRLALAGRGGPTDPAGGVGSPAGGVEGVETVAVAPGGGGLLALVDRYGAVRLAEPSSAEGDGGYRLSPPQPIAHVTPGRVLGAAFASHPEQPGRLDLYVANAPMGLLRLEHVGEAAKQRLVLATGRVSDESPLAPGTPVEFANGVAVASDGAVYFSVSTDVSPYRTPEGNAGVWDVLAAVFVALAKAQPGGMLCKYDPRSGVTTALMSGLWFANGVALSRDESYVLVADSIQGAVHRYWLKGPRAGESELLVDRLPGPPDGVSRAAGGDGGGDSFWVTVFCEPPPLVSLTQSRLVRLLLAWAPRVTGALGLQVPRRMGLVLRIDGDGRVVEALADRKGRHVWGVTSAVEAPRPGGPDGARVLLLGSIARRGVPVVDL